MDWEPGYREFAPPAAGGKALHCLWVSVVPADESIQTPVLPDACTDLIWQSDVGAYVAGPDTGPNPALLPPGTVLVGARFRPGAGGAALGVPLSKLLDQRVDAADLPAVPARRLPGSLAPAEALRRVAGIAADLATERPPDHLVLEVARRLGRPGERADLVSGRLGLDAAGAVTDLAGLAAETGYADQAHLTRESARLAGLTPAALARVRRR